MGHKSIVIIDLDHLDMIRNDPEQFCSQLLNQINSYKRTGGSVNMHVKNAIATPATVVYTGHTDTSPEFRFVDFSVVDLSI